eukprot:1144027-Pelagomonas_calceolata.AAC.3
MGGCPESTHYQEAALHTTRLVGMHPTCKAIAQQEAFITFPISNHVPWVATLKALLAEDMDCGTALGEGWSLLLEPCMAPRWHSRLLHAELATQDSLGYGSMGYGSADSRWMPEPDAMELPDAAVLHPIICAHMLSGNLYRLYADVLREVVTGWSQKKKIPKTQGESTLPARHFFIKQGCPLPPLLFSLYINDVDCLAENVQGAVTGKSEVRVMHVLCIDDLYLTGDQPQQLQLLLDRLHVYAQRKGLVMNAAKSETVHFNLRSDSVPVINIGGARLIVQIP